MNAVSETPIRIVAHVFGSFYQQEFFGCYGLPNISLNTVPATLGI